MHAPSIVMVLSHLHKRVAHDICRVETHLVSSERYFPAVCLLKTQMEFARELERGNAIVAGFRLVDLDYEENNVRGIPVVVDLTLLGATFGFMFD